MKDSDKERVRAELLDRLRSELVGPNAEDELLDEPPAQRYLCGILWPGGITVDRGEDESFAAGAEGEESGNLETTAPLAQAMRPSSIGLSFVVERECVRLRVRAAWGVYTLVPVPGQRKDHWQRTALAEDLVVELTPDGRRQIAQSGQDPGVRIEWLARPLEDRVAVSLFLVNRKLRGEKGPLDPVCIFQPCLEIRGEEDGTSPFVMRELQAVGDATGDLELAQDQLLYRQFKTFAVGHGTAVDWSEPAGAVDRVAVLSTVTMPDVEVPKVIPPVWDQGGSLNMQDLAEAPDVDSVYDCLEPLAQAYDDWIFAREQEVDSLPPDLHNHAREHHIAPCRKALSRIRDGLDLIRERPEVFAAFRLANRAMAWQRQQVRWAVKARKSRDWSAGPEQVASVWRPFQVAFILQAIKGIVEPTHDDRMIADLLWFPTGGGKTEAYLGLSAFIMALRRLRGEQDGRRGDAGVTVIMRYTLRLLTIQQFQRAATLMCAMELIREEDPGKWGDEPFRIGLWVGGNSTPNNYTDAETALLKKTGTSTPVQLVACPWCGSPLGAKHYQPLRKLRRVIISCSRPQCEFHTTNRRDGIPALVEDEEIYRLAPALVIGTVDKFARIAWAPETQALFGRVRGQVPGWGFTVDGEELDTARWRAEALGAQKLTDRIADARPLLPPELIIQDELHLISGPLGTMVGLYEAAIDQLCTRDVDGRAVVPKVVASTATIRRAGDQVRNLFARRAAVFPPPGLEAGDSFFAQRQPLSKEPGRVYLGIFAPGRSVKTALVRVYAVLLAATAAVKAAPRDVDPYYTLVGYYNSLRELGGAVRLVEDDIRTRMQLLANPRRLGGRYPFVVRPLEDQVEELTSRVDSSAIPVVLDRLDRVWDGSNRSQERPVDVVLASNMISVGVDVGRLGLMVVTGQPKTTSEYIQATSRVGREHPGLVVTVYNWARPRDLSHYERFRPYHAAFYRHVEAISVTPFSARARDRALAATFIALCRQRVTGIAGRNQAGRFKPADAAVKALRQRLLDRVQDLDQAWRLADVEREVTGIVDKWHNAAQKGALHYAGADKNAIKVMYPLGDRPNGRLFGVPNSMRDVEETVNLYLLPGEEQ